MADPSTFDLQTFLPYQLTVLADRTSRAFAARYKERFGISVAEWRVVAHLSQSAQPVSVREIHAKVAMDKSKVSRAAARLEAAGYVSKSVASHDGRLVDLTLTQKGYAMMAELAREAHLFQTALEEALGARDAAFQDALARLNRAL